MRPVRDILEAVRDDHEDLRALAAQLKDSGVDDDERRQLLRALCFELHCQADARHDTLDQYLTGTAEARECIEECARTIARLEDTARQLESSSTSGRVWNDHAESFHAELSAYLDREETTLVPHLEGRLSDHTRIAAGLHYARAKQRAHRRLQRHATPDSDRANQ